MFQTGWLDLRISGKIPKTSFSQRCLCGYVFNMFFAMEYGLSRVMRKHTFCICENKDADQLRDCFRYIDSTIALLPNSEISSI